MRGSQPLRRSDVASHAAAVALDSGKFRELLLRHELQCLDDEWKGWSRKYRFRCRQGHVFDRSADALARARTGACLTCATELRNRRLSDATRAAGVTCLEAGWLGSKAGHRCRCPAGHHWLRTGEQLLRRAQCPHCHRQSTQDHQLQQLEAQAARHGGECLVDRFAGLNWRYSFRCRQGHEWKAVGAAVLRGSWCPVCAREQRLLKASGTRKRKASSG
ncbi:hypothetical protein PA57_05651 [Pseudomonas aeruginosa]|nr:hypothetical protein PA57_05651 [Pseudomonas aeruginosa]